MDSLDKNSIDSFLRVAGGLTNAGNVNNREASAESNPDDSAQEDHASIIESAVKEGENIRLVLRSNGHEFPAKDNTTDAINPAYVVCLAHHVPTDLFILFAFNATTMPCQLIRFDRDGNVVDSDVIHNNLCWNAIDTAALVAAVNKCHEGNAEYFDNVSKLQRDAPSSACVEDREHAFAAGEHLRLVPSSGHDEEDANSEDEDVEGVAKDSEKEKEEYEAIRTLILRELIYTDGRGDDGVQFQHPDPKFLLSLSESISHELRNWRYLRQYHLPIRSEWPKLPSPSEWEKEGMSNREERGQEVMSAMEKKDFDKIVQGRSTQVETSVKHCQISMEKIESLLRTLLEEGNSATISSISYLLGKEIVASLALLRHIQQNNPFDWINYHDIFENFQQYSDQLSDINKRSLVKWLEKANTDPESSKPSDRENYEFDPRDSAYDVASRLYDLWEKEEESLLGALGRVAAAVEHCLKTGKEQHCFESVFDCIKSEQAFVSSLQVNSKRVTEKNATRLVKLLSEAPSDYDEDLTEDNLWLRDATSPNWTYHNLQSHLSFGWYMLECKNFPGLSFVVDHKGLMTSVRDHMNTLEISRPTREYCRLTRKEEFEKWWETNVDPLVDSTSKIIEDLLAMGDLFNSSIAILSFLGVLCNSDVLEGLWSKYNKYGDSGGKDAVEKFIIPKFQGVWRKCDALVVKVAFAYFNDEYSNHECDGHWFLNTLKSGLLYSPNHTSGKLWMFRIMFHLN